MTKEFRLLSILLLTILIVCTTVVGGYSTQEWECYEDKDLQFKVKYPLEWKVNSIDTSNGTGESFCFTFVGNSKTALPLLEIEVVKTSESIELIEKDLNGQMEYYEGYPSCNFSEVRRCAFHGQKALEWNVTDSLFKQLQYSIAVKNRDLAYKISFKNSISDWNEEWENTIQEIKGSWEFL